MLDVTCNAFMRPMTSFRLGEKVGNILNPQRFGRGTKKRNGKRRKTRTKTSRVNKKRIRSASYYNNITHY